MADLSVSEKLDMLMTTVGKLTKTADKSLDLLEQLSVRQTELEGAVASLTTANPTSPFASAAGVPDVCLPVKNKQIEVELKNPNGCYVHIPTDKTSDFRVMCPHVSIFYIFLYVNIIYFFMYIFFIFLFFYMYIFYIF